MKLLLTVAVALFVPALGYAQGPKNCDDLKSEIAQKLDAKGVKSYSLEIVDKDKDAEGKVVGTCGGGTKKIMYLRTTSAPEKPAKAKEKEKEKEKDQKKPQ